MCRAKEEDGEEQSHMAFLCHDISMLRLFETFLENTPQLTLLLCVILQTNKAEPSQGMGLEAWGQSGWMGQTGWGRQGWS